MQQLLKLLAKWRIQLRSKRDENERGKMKKLSIILSIWFSCATLCAQTENSTLPTDSLGVEGVEALQASVTTNFSKQAGDEAFAQNDFAGAIAIYEHIIDNQGVSAELFYNVGNSYFKMNEIAKAIINFERALLLNPSDKDIQFNLELAKGKTVDKVTPQPEIFLVTWYHAVTNSLSEKAWAIVGILLFLGAIALIALYLFAKSMIVRKVSFITGGVFALLCLFANLFASHQKSELLDQSHAIIIQPSVTVKSTPNAGGTDLFIVHEGRKVMIKDDSMKSWKEIELEDGHVGWIPTDALEII